MSNATKLSTEINPARDFSYSVPVRTRYLVLASPRSGSTWLCRSLQQTQIAGDPLEYFSPYLLSEARRRFKAPDLGFSEFIARMERLRTSMNGIFGMQLHYSQLADAFKTLHPTPQWKKFLERFQYFIWIRRRDKLAQAVSIAIAVRTKAWSSEDRPLPVTENDFTEPFLMKSLQAIAMNDLNMQHLIEKFDLPCKTIWYEDFALHPNETVRDALRYIGATPNELVNKAQPITKQGTELNEVLKSRLASYLGISAT